MSSTKVKPRRSARERKMDLHAFLIWRYADPRGWDVTMRQVGEAIGLTPQRVGQIARRHGWRTRFRTTTLDGEGIYRHAYSSASSIGVLDLETEDRGWK